MELVLGVEIILVLILEVYKLIFVSHAWLNSQPDQRFIEFVKFLRDNGYEAECDVMHLQQKSATHFTEMMANALRSAEKIIIVLSEKYKEGRMLWEK